MAGESRQCHRGWLRSGQEQLENGGKVWFSTAAAMAAATMAGHLDLNLDNSLMLFRGNNSKIEYTCFLKISLAFGILGKISYTIIII